MQYMQLMMCKTKTICKDKSHDIMGQSIKQLLKVQEQLQLNFVPKIIINCYF